MAFITINIITFLYDSVFWDLYCAAPERRETCDHSSEAKAFHDYVSFISIGLSSDWDRANEMMKSTAILKINNSLSLTP